MDASPASCARCGAPVRGGRFCTNCGVPLGSAQTVTDERSTTDTAERVYPQPVYAERPYPERPYAAPSHVAPQRGPGPGVWFAIAGAMVVVLIVGGFLLVHGLGGSPSATSPTTAPPAHDSPSASSTPTKQPSTHPTTASSPPTPPTTGPATDVAGLARASAPAHSPPGVDLDGRPVTFVAANMVDGAADTCWRRSGNATGTVLTFRLDQPTKLSKVGLINGYAKIAYGGGHRYDWYRGNRRVLDVTWTFDDGTTVSQHLTDTMAMQTLPITPVTTQTVRLRIDAVTPPGHGRAGRDETAVSEVSLVGRTA
jgi:hypothetical protein